jgi:hypothetical protein
VNNRGAHVVIALKNSMRMLMFDEFHCVDIAASIERYPGGEGMRLRDLADTFEIALAGRHSEDLARAIWAYGLDGDIGSVESIVRRRESKARRHAVFEDVESHRTGAGLQGTRLAMLVVMTGMNMAVKAAMFMMGAAATKEKNTGDVNRES